MGNNISLMGFTFFVKSNIGKYIPYRVDETAIKVVGRRRKNRWVRIQGLPRLWRRRRLR